MAVYSDKSPTTQFRTDKKVVETNSGATGEYGVSSSSGMYITNLTQKQLKGSLLAVKVFGTAHTAIVLVDTDYTLRLVVAGGAALSTATGQALVDTSSGNSNTTDNKVNFGWYTSSVSGEKHFAICNRLDSVSLADNTIEVTVL